MQSSTILITGGTGYIGTYIGLLFAQKGFRVIFLDKPELRPAGQNPWAISITGNYGDMALLSLIFRSYQIEAIIHCGTSNEASFCLDYYHNDLINTIKLLEQMRAYAIKKFIFTSSASVYGNAAGTIDHDTVNRPNNSHGKCMQMIETILADYAENQEFLYIILRLFYTAGEIPDHNLIYAHNSYNPTIAALIESVITGKPFYYYDTDHQTPDGSIIRDYAHVWDIARAHFAAYTYLTQHQKSDYFNIGSNKGISIKHLLGITEKLLNKKIKTLMHKSKTTESPCLIADISKATDLLNWHPTHSAIEFILKTSFRKLF